jgi:hypothetical protein
MIGLRIADITAAESGAWLPRWAWEHFDTALRAGGTLLRVHDTLYACQRYSPPAHHHSRKGGPVMTATRCTCGFQRLDDEEVTDHLLAAFAPGDSTGSDGLVHQELAAKACSCGFAATPEQGLDSHFLAMFTPAASVARDGVAHEPAP